MPDTLKALLPEVCQRFQKQREAIIVNQQFFRGLLEAAGLVDHEEDGYQGGGEAFDDPGSIAAILTQLKREWSADGHAERQQCFETCLEALKQHLPVKAGEVARSRVLVAGAGLGRANFEVACCGYDTLGLERAMTMYMTSQYVLGSLLPSGSQVTICPYAHEISPGPNNVRLSEHLSRTTSVPDESALALVKTREASTTGDLRILPGDFNSFCALEREHGRWDACLSIFYVDASGDALEATMATRAVLKPGGLWICCGPLEFDGGGGEHRSEGALRLCGDELLLFVSRSGFDLLEVRDMACGYTGDPLSMLQTGFKAIFFVARKQ